jgi:hypothetical protein
MRTFVRFSPMPYCRICGKQMDHWIIGLPDDQHAHPLCQGQEITDEAMVRLRKMFDKLNSGRGKCYQNNRRE